MLRGRRKGNISVSIWILFDDGGGKKGLAAAGPIGGPLVAAGPSRAPAGHAWRRIAGSR
jgi:hypothetical protein